MNGWMVRLEAFIIYAYIIIKVDVINSKGVVGVSRTQIH
jgi:hypothetical protein